MAQQLPPLIRSLPAFEGPFEARRLEASACDVLFARYPAGTEMEPHSHETENVGIVTSGELILVTASGERRFGPGEWYHLDAGERHGARFEIETAEIEFWFPPEAPREPPQHG